MSVSFSDSDMYTRPVIRATACRNLCGQPGAYDGCSQIFRAWSRLGRNAVTGEAGPARAGAAACELARNGSQSPLTATRKRGRHSGGFVHIREIRGLLSSQWFSLRNPEDRKVTYADS